MTDNGDQAVEVTIYHVVYAEGYGALLVQFPPDLKESGIVRVTVGQLPDAQRFLFAAS